MLSKAQLLQVFTCLDLTSLESVDNEGTLKLLINKANFSIDNKHVAAVCVYPNLGSIIKNFVSANVKTAVVGGYFPSGQTFTEAKIAELKIIERSAIDEVDIVINRGAFLDSKFDYVLNELQLMRSAIPSKTLKIILETGELKTEASIRHASEIAIQAGADFIKTSTGKSGIGATPEAVEIMCKVIKNHYLQTGKKIGIKPSGGVRTIAQALSYIDVVERIIGSEWIHPDLFRIGASSLYDELIKEFNDENNR